MEPIIIVAIVLAGTGLGFGACSSVTSILTGVCVYRKYSKTTSETSDVHIIHTAHNQYNNEGKKIDKQKTQDINIKNATQETLNTTVAGLQTGMPNQVADNLSAGGVAIASGIANQGGGGLVAMAQEGISLARDYVQGQNNNNAPPAPPAHESTLLGTLISGTLPKFNKHSDSNHSHPSYDNGQYSSQYFGPPSGYYGPPNGMYYQQFQGHPYQSQYFPNPDSFRPHNQGPATADRTDSAQSNSESVNSQSEVSSARDNASDPLISKNKEKILHFAVSNEKFNQANFRKSDLNDELSEDETQEDQNNYKKEEIIISGDSSEESIN